MRLEEKWEYWEGAKTEGRNCCKGEGCEDEKGGSERGRAGREDEKLVGRGRRSERIGREEQMLLKERGKITN